MYDAIVVGARCAGASAALLLAHRSLSVLLLERGEFGTDTLCTRWLSPAAVALLERWGLIGWLVRAGCPAAGAVTVAVGDSVERLELPGGGLTCAPRRLRLDRLLLDAAREAGVPARDCFSVAEVVWEDERVVGVVGHGADGRARYERAEVVVGADGMSSRVARSVAAEVYRHRDSTACCHYAYWSGLTLDGPECFISRHAVVTAVPTDDGLACVAAFRPVAQWPELKRAPEDGYGAAVRSFPALAERLSGAFRESRFFGTADLGACLRRGAGPGWALVGDAGHRVEPLAGSGIADAFLQAEWLAEALGATSEDWSAPGGALDAYQERRDACLLGPFNSVAGVSALPGPLEVVPAVLALLQRTWADRLDLVRTLRV